MAKVDTDMGREIANAEQAKAWDGEEGLRWAEHAERYESAAPRHLERMFHATAIAPTDAVLDVGCGTGGTTRDAARRAPEGSALGIDLSGPMLRRAREQSRAEGLANVTFVHADAQVHPFDESTCDLAISSFGGMFFDDPVAAYTNIGRALRPNGRLALLVWRELPRNEWVSEIRAALALGRDLPVPPPDAPTPFSFADPDRVRRILGDAGYTEIAFESVEEPLTVGADADDAYAFMRTMGIVEGLLHDVDGAGRARGLTQLRASVDAHAGADGVQYGTSAWLVTAQRP